MGARVTDFFATGDTKVLIGTRALLGEGWDAPTASGLIDLSMAEHIRHRRADPWPHPASRSARRGQGRGQLDRLLRRRRSPEGRQRLAAHGDQAPRLLRRRPVGRHRRRRRPHPSRVLALRATAGRHLRCPQRRDAGACRAPSRHRRLLAGRPALRGRGPAVGLGAVRSRSGCRRSPRTRPSSRASRCRADRRRCTPARARPSAARASSRCWPRPRWRSCSRRRRGRPGPGWWVRSPRSEARLGANAPAQWLGAGPAAHRARRRAARLRAGRRPAPRRTHQRRRRGGRVARCCRRAACASCSTPTRSATARSSPRPWPSSWRRSSSRATSCRATWSATSGPLDVIRPLAAYRPRGRGLAPGAVRPRRQGGARPGVRRGLADLGRWRAGRLHRQPGGRRRPGRQPRYQPARRHAACSA